MPRGCFCCWQGFESIIKGKYLSGHDKAQKATMQKYNITTDARKPEQVHYLSDMTHSRLPQCTFQPKEQPIGPI